MSGSKFANLAKMGSNLLFKNVSVRPVAVSKFCSGIPPDTDSAAKTNTKIEDKEKVPVIYETKKVKFSDLTDPDRWLDAHYGRGNWRRDSENPNKIEIETYTPSQGFYRTWVNLD